MENDLDPLVEWAVWGHLNSKTNLELILLEGHLLLEMVLDMSLKRNNIQNYQEYSFYRKVTTLEKIDFEDNVKKNFIISSLKEINNLRNRFSHEFNFNVKNGELEIWALNIMTRLEGTKHTNYTSRTKIVHSFSFLSKNILDLSK